MRAVVALLPLLGGCFFSDDHGHGGSHEREPLPETVTRENAESVLELSLRRVGARALGEGAVYVAWKTVVGERTVVSGIQKQTARSGPGGSWTRIPIANIRKVEVTVPEQAGLKLWGITFHGETFFGSGELQQGMTATPFSIWSSDGDAVRALATSVQVIREMRKGPP